MYGWRGRLGIILPADNVVLEPDLYRMLLEGVSAHVVRLQKAPRPEMPDMAVQSAQAFVHARVGVVGYMCAASSFLLGPKGNAGLCDRLSAAAGGVPSFTASTAAVDALQMVRATRIAVLAPHAPELADKLAGYLEDSGFAVADLRALGLDLADINDASPSRIYREARALDTKGADSVFIAATNFRAIDVIGDLETDTGLPVVTSNQAALWKALALLGIAADSAGFGGLFEAARGRDVNR